MDEYLFVYGTLRRSLAHPMHRALARGAVYVRDATCPGRLFDLGLYPGAVLDDAARERIRGEVYRLTDGATVLGALDRYEGCAAGNTSPQEYSREQADVCAADGGAYRAWVYVYRGTLDHAAAIVDGDYAAHCRMIVRSERAEDQAAIDRVNRLAFGGEQEARLIRALRTRDDFDFNLSLVAAQGGEIVGHILFSPIAIERDGGATSALALAPMAVVPEHQNRGIGSRLVRVGLRMCRERGCGIVVVLGHSAYYPRFGFTPAAPLGIAAPFAVPEDAFMVCELAAGALEGVRGTVRYSSAFDEVA